jgi:hypothetical protein
LEGRNSLLFQRVHVQIPPLGMPVWYRRNSPLNNNMFPITHSAWPETASNNSSQLPQFTGSVNTCFTQESATSDELYCNPKFPYTVHLIYLQLKILPSLIIGGNLNASNSLEISSHNVAEIIKICEFCLNFRF